MKMFRLFKSENQDNTLAKRKREPAFGTSTPLRFKVNTGTTYMDHPSVNVYDFSNQTFLKKYEELKHQYQAELAKPDISDRKKKFLQTNIDVINKSYQNALALEALEEEEIVRFLQCTRWNATADKTINNPLGFLSAIAMIESKHVGNKYLRVRPVNVQWLPEKPADPIVVVELITEGEEYQMECAVWTRDQELDQIQFRLLDIYESFKQSV